MLHFDTNKYRQDRSALEITDADIAWARLVLYDTFTENWCKQNPTDYYTTEGYFPPDSRKTGEKVSIVNFLKLKDSTPLNILDIGAGAGQFLKLCAAYGHTVQGTEIPEVVNSAVSELYKHYNVDIFPLIIKKAEKIILPQQYDIITTARTVFDREDGYYTASDWLAWKDNMLEYLTPNGRLFIKTNLKYYKSGVNPENQEIIDAFGLPLLGWNSCTYIFTKN